VEPRLLEAAKVDLESGRVAHKQTHATIAATYVTETPAANSGSSSGTAGTTSHRGYNLDPNSATRGLPLKTLSSEHPVLFTFHLQQLAQRSFSRLSKAVEEALKDEKDFKIDDLLRDQFRGWNLPRRKTFVKNSDSVGGLRKEIRARVSALR